MARSTARKRRATLAGIALSLVLVAAGSLPALAGGYVAKTFTMNVSPTPVIAGTSRAFSVAIKNTSNISLGSINLTVPPLLTITGASASKGTVTQAGNLVQVRTVGLGAGKSMTITVNAVAPCKTTTLTWYVMAMSGSNYTGTTFALDTTKSTKTTKVNGTCTLAFVARTPAGKRASERGHLVGRLRPERRTHPGEGPRRLGQPVVVPGQHRVGHRQQPRRRHARRNARRRRPAAGSRRSTT